MTRSRKILLSLVSIAFLAGSAYDLAADQEHWPFSQYPMFSVAWHAPSFTWYRLYGVTRDRREFPLDQNRYIAPFDQSRLPKALRRMLEEEDGVARVRAALIDCLVRYRELAADGEHDGPPIDGLRLYEVRWRIDADAANVDTPDRRTLVAEVERP
jgi:hypothetical protein